MDKTNQYLKVDINTSEKNLCLNEQYILNISITNIGDIPVENGLLRLFIDTDSIEILDERIKHCVSDFSSIGMINPQENININIPIKIKSIPQENKSYIYTLVNFHIIKNGNLIDQNYESDRYECKLYDLNIIKSDDFKIETFKDIYLIDEDIYYFLSVKNNGNSTLENIEICEFIPENTYIVRHSMIPSSTENILIDDSYITIKQLDPGEEINLKYKVNIIEDISITQIKVSPMLTYDNECINNIKVRANEVVINIKEKEFFNENSFNRTISKYIAYDKDILEHTVIIKNTTDTYISNIALIEDVPCDLNFVENSLIVNGIHRVNENLDNPIKLGDIEPDEQIIVTYNTIVNSISQGLEVNSILNYDTNRRNITQNSNKCKLKIARVHFDTKNFIKIQENKNISVGDIINYSIILINTGNIPIVDIVVKDTIPSKLTLVDDSLYIDGVESKGNIADGININSIEPNQKVDINYSLKATGIVSNEKSSATLSYYYKDSDKKLSAVSNTVETTVLGAKIGENNFLKEISSDTCQIGDIVTIRLSIENTGNIDCESLKLYEPYNSSLEFIHGSLRIENVESSDTNIFDGINITTLKLGESFYITYQMKIIDYPKPNPIDDRARLSYSYIKNGKLKIREIYSSRKKIYINNPILSVVDSNSIYDNGNLIKYISYKDYTFFSLCFENKGNVGIEDINLKLVIPEGFILKNDSIRLNNHEYDGLIEDRFKLPNLNVSQKFYLNFYVKHVQGNTLELDSYLYIDYTFRDIKNKSPYKKNIKINERILVVNPDIEVTKFLSDEDIELDREFTKNINIKNIGNIALENIKLTLNESDFLKQCENNLFINGNYTKNCDVLNIDKIDIDETINIAIRYKLEYIPLCESILKESIITAEYKFLENQSPLSITKKSNKLKLDIKNYDILLKGKCSSETLNVGETANYIFTVTNVGNMNCDTIKLKIHLPECIKYIEDSLCINGKKIYYNKINSGIELGDLAYNQSTVVSFDFKATKLPYNKIIKVDGVASCKFNCRDSYVSKNFFSKSKDITIESVNLDVIKSVSHDYLQNGDILKVHTVLQNTGSIKINDILIKDNYENNLFFVEESIYIDDSNKKDISPLDGIKIGCLEPDESKLISYEYEYIPRISSAKVTHFSEVNYSYKSLKDTSTRYNTSKSNMIYIEGALSTFKQFSIDREHILKDYDPDIKEILNVFSDAKIEEFYEIDSFKNKSYDNSSYINKKIIVKGTIVDRVEYLVDNEESSLYMLTNQQPFTIFINIPSDYYSEELYLKAKCDDIFYKGISKRGVFVSNLISIEGSM